MAHANAVKSEMNDAEEAKLNTRSAIAAVSCIANSQHIRPSPSLASFTVTLGSVHCSATSMSATRRAKLPRSPTSPT
eukprot:763403-Hanusia_phi.AAC.1